MGLGPIAIVCVLRFFHLETHEQTYTEKITNQDECQQAYSLRQDDMDGESVYAKVEWL